MRLLDAGEEAGLPFVVLELMRGETLRHAINHLCMGYQAALQATGVGSMITLHPISRFLLEYIRVDESPVFGTGLSISQNLSLALLAVAAGLWVWILRKPPGRLAFPLPAGNSREPRG